jgi:predicted lipid carrier protein YhbT
MSTAPVSHPAPGRGAWPRLRDLPRPLLRPLPLFAIQPWLSLLVRAAVRRRPQLFERLEAQRRRRYLIDPLNLPFVLLLEPDPHAPSLRALRRTHRAAYDARIAGTLLTLLAMVDARRDGDALFFSRDLVVEGDTEAVVALRNALDDIDGSLAEDVAAGLGLPALAILSLLRRAGAGR